MSLDEGLGELLSLAGSFGWREVFELLFKAEEPIDAFDGLVCEDALALLIGDGGDVEELPAGVGPTADFEEVLSGQEQGVVVAGGVGLQVVAGPVLEEIANVLAFLGEGEVVDHQVGGGSDVGPGSGAEGSADGLER